MSFGLRPGSLTDYLWERLFSPLSRSLFLLGKCLPHNVNGRWQQRGRGAPQLDLPGAQGDSAQAESPLGAFLSETHRGPSHGLPHPSFPQILGRLLPPVPTSGLLCWVCEVLSVFSDGCQPG